MAKISQWLRMIDQDIYTSFFLFFMLSKPINYIIASFITRNYNVMLCNVALYARNWKHRNFADASAESIFDRRKKKKKLGLVEGFGLRTSFLASEICIVFLPNFAKFTGDVVFWSTVHPFCPFSKHLEANLVLF